MRTIWQFISILLAALVTGVFWGTWLGLSRSMASLTPETFLTVGHTMIGNLGTIAFYVKAHLESTTLRGNYGVYPCRAAERQRIG